MEAIIFDVGSWVVRLEGTGEWPVPVDRVHAVSPHPHMDFENAGTRLDTLGATCWGASVNFRLAEQDEIDSVIFKEDDLIMPVNECAYAGPLPARSVWTVGQHPVVSGWRHATAEEYRDAIQKGEELPEETIEIDEEPPEETIEIDADYFKNKVVQIIHPELESIEESLAEHEKRLNLATQRMDGLLDGTNLNYDHINSLVEDQASMQAEVVDILEALKLRVESKLSEKTQEPVVDGVLWQARCSKTGESCPSRTYARLGDDVDDDGLARYTSNILDSKTLKHDVYRLNPAGMEPVPNVDHCEKKELEEREIHLHRVKEIEELKNTHRKREVEANDRGYVLGKEIAEKYAFFQPRVCLLLCILSALIGAVVGHPL